MYGNPKSISHYFLCCIEPSTKVTGSRISNIEKAHRCHAYHPRRFILQCQQESKASPTHAEPHTSAQRTSTDYLILLSNSHIESTNQICPNPLLCRRYTGMQDVIPSPSMHGEARCDSRTIYGRWKVSRRPSLACTYVPQGERSLFVPACF